jgi:hypothetical protein
MNTALKRIKLMIKIKDQDQEKGLRGAVGGGRWRGPNGAQGIARPTTREDWNRRKRWSNGKGRKRDHIAASEEDSPGKSSSREKDRLVFRGPRVLAIWVSIANINTTI